MKYTIIHEIVYITRDTSKTSNIAILHYIYVQKTTRCSSQIQWQHLAFKMSDDDGNDGGTQSRRKTLLITIITLLIYMTGGPFCSVQEMIGVEKLEQNKYKPFGLLVPIWGMYCMYCSVHLSTC